MGISFSSIFLRLFEKRKVEMLMVGLEAAGKTTILYKLKMPPVGPTLGFTVKTVEYKNICVSMWDVGGGQTRMRPLWKDYFQTTQGLIFVVDSSDRSKIAEAGEELSQLLTEDDLKNVALLVFANKQDLPHTMSTEELTDKLGIFSIKNRRWYVQATCATQGSGIHEGLDWLSTEIAKTSH